MKYTKSLDESGIEYECPVNDALETIEKRGCMERLDMFNPTQRYHMFLVDAINGSTIDQIDSFNPNEYCELLHLLW